MNISPLRESLEHAISHGLVGVVAGVSSPDETLFLDARGRVGLNEDDAPLSPHAVFALYSATKAVTATAALQCIEEGLVELDDSATTYLPELAELRVLERIDDDETVHTRAPKTPVTIRSLLLHTSGMGYDLFDPQLARIARTHPPASLRESLRGPLLHDPGTEWTYGRSLDVLGLIVQEVRQQRLEDVFRRRIFEPCAMTSTSFDMPPALRKRLIPAHRRRLTRVPGEVPDSPELDMGGQGLFSTAADFLAFLRVWLGDGSAPHGQVLRPETMAWAVQSAPGVTPTALHSAIPALTGSIDFTSGTPTSWAYSFLRTDNDVPHGRRAGTLSWAGLANVHYWVDRTSGVAAVWSAQLLPWLDPVAAEQFSRFEQAVYAS